jgi:hypothetical protein
MGASVTDIGKPIFESSALGDLGDGTKPGGYSMIIADDLEAALTLAKDCPVLREGAVSRSACSPACPPTAEHRHDRRDARREGRAGQQGAGLAARSVSARTLTGPVHQDLTNDHRRQT